MAKGLLLHIYNWRVPGSLAGGEKIPLCFLFDWVDGQQNGSPDRYRSN